MGFPPIVYASALDARSGFVADGANAGDQTGYSVAGVGDVNGDGVDDLIIGAPQAAANGHARAGKAYVVFGRHNCPGDLNADGRTDVFDFTLFAGDFGCAP